ncbi:kelch repeat-containing protein [Streptomyces sp. NPDC002205]|uniref:kelch repeat-containing protein n=1 Tax=Streptomyces sp. NPDC002205 TaxID=3154411 RepID=UPI003323306D
MGRRPLLGTAIAVVALTAGLLTGSAAGADGPDITVSTNALTAGAELGGSTQETFTVTNHGTDARTVTLAESGGGFTIQGLKDTGAPRREIAGTPDPHRLATGGDGQAKAAPQEASPAEAPWQDITDHPAPVMDNLAATGPGGKVYSVAGISDRKVIATARVYDPVAGTWSTVAPLSQPREKPAGAFIDGKLYVTGGWGAPGDVLNVAATEVYDPATDSWATKAASPTPLGGQGAAVLDGQLYTVGGCTLACGSPAVLAYNPVTDEWSKKAEYPELVAWPSCGTLGGRLYCAGGEVDQNGVAVPIKNTYAYDPATDSWTKLAPMPEGLFGAASSAANGQLLVSGGSNGQDSYTNAGYQYDPQADSWSALPNANHIAFRGGSACGLYRIGGTTGGLAGIVANAEKLPGYEACGDGVDWLTTDDEAFTVQPGATHTVTVKMDTSGFSQPGTYTAALRLGTDHGDHVDPVKVTLTVKAPPQWGKIAGTITTAACAPGGANPLEKASVTLTAKGVHRVIRTAKDGTYALWIGEHEGPLTVIVSKDDWQPSRADVTLQAGATRTVPLALDPYPSCPAA